VRSLVAEEHREADRSAVASSHSRRPPGSTWRDARTLASSRSVPLRPSAVPIGRQSGGSSNGLTGMSFLGGIGKGYPGPSQRLSAGLDPTAPAPEAADEALEPIGGVDDPSTTGATGTTAPSSAAPPAPTAVGGLDISDFKVSGPTWSPHGAFDWRVKFTTSGRNGWLVQEIVNTIDVKNAAGAAVNTAGVVPRYWEAWAVDASGQISPSAGPVHDMWIRPNWGANTVGRWSMSGRLHFTTTDPATQGFTPGGVSNAGILLSTATAPAGLGAVLRWRMANGQWDDTSTPAKPHTGTSA
jgi:hypothetical protein